MTYTLKLLVVDKDVRNKYVNAVNNMRTPAYLSNPNKDSGFDIFTPQEQKFDPRQTILVDLGIKGAMFDDRCNAQVPSAYYLYARSSIYKTPFRLANNVGIVDSGYRGNLKGAFDNITTQPQTIPQNARLLQICAPDLSPFKIKISNHLNYTVRGDGGFGSSGV